MKTVHVIKAFGRKDLFSEEKLRRSLRRSGVSNDIVTDIMQEIISHLQDGMTTKEIYKQAFQLLKQYSRPGAARYKLKQAINELGPSGFPFELYVAELLKTDGYTVETGVVVQGHCVKHELDVVAAKENHHFLVECKFHNSQGVHSDVKVPLYIQSRFLDVTVKWKELRGHENKFHQAWLITNTRFTEDAIAYGKCMNIHMISWDYPHKQSLRERVNAAGLHPITCLVGLTKQEKMLLLNKKIVLCKQLLLQPGSLQSIGMKNALREKSILAEAGEVCRQYDLHDSSGQ